MSSFLLSFEIPMSDGLIVLTLLTAFAVLSSWLLRLEIDEVVFEVPQAVKHTQRAIPVIPIINFFILPPFYHF